MYFSEQEKGDVEQDYLDTLDFYADQIEVLEEDRSDCEEELSGMYYKTPLFPALKERIDEITTEIEEWETKYEKEQLDFEAIEWAE